jgi:hypothetical protein
VVGGYRVKLVIIRTIMKYSKVSYPKLCQLHYIGTGGHSQTRRESEEEESESSCSSQGRLSRDERLVKEMRIPLTVREIIEKPMEEFNDLLTRKDITEEQINICRDIRRRGKNKVRNTSKLLSKLSC